MEFSADCIEMGRPIQLRHQFVAKGVIHAGAGIILHSRRYSVLPSPCQCLSPMKINRSC